MGGVLVTVCQFIMNIISLITLNEVSEKKRNEVGKFETCLCLSDILDGNALTNNDIISPESCGIQANG